MYIYIVSIYIYSIYIFIYYIIYTYISSFENIGAGTLATNGWTFYSVYSDTDPLSNSFQIVTAVNPRFKTTADG